MQDLSLHACFLSSGAKLEHLRRSVMMQIKVSSPSIGVRGEALWDPVHVWATIKNRAMVSGGSPSPGHPGRCKDGERDGQRYDKGLVMKSQLVWRWGLAGASAEGQVAPYSGDVGMPGHIVSVP